ncbi:protein SCAR2-like isoform X1 [Ananas comosus]|uniref:Protein SCAR n=1 Tax=Ananas comosus TaxID=4615 RepID=A0A6P5GQV6_ANACO|nr:protein SCAR2-like isoform X1 [Ananas comosus]
MPLLRYEIRNEYGLGKSELRGATENDDSEALLEGVTMAGLVGLLRQLGDLAEFAAEIFHGLHEEVICVAARGHGMMLRAQQLEAAIPLVEKGFPQINYSHLAYNAGSNWHSNLNVKHNLITRGDTPRFIMDSYKECHRPPKLFMLDKFDIAGAGACLKRYSDPTFYKTDSASSRKLLENTRREKRARKVTNMGLNRKNAEITESLSMPNNSTKSRMEISDQFSDGFPVRGVKLKYRRLNESKQGSLKNHMQHLIEIDSPDNLNMKYPDLVESINEIREIKIDSSEKIERNHSSSFRVKNITVSSIPEEEPEIECKDLGVLTVPPEHSGEIKRNISLPNLDQNDMFYEDKYGLVVSPVSEIHSTPTNQVFQADFMPDAESETVGSTDGYISDDAPSELENYMDALSTMESEVETDTESKGRFRQCFLGSRRFRSITHEELHFSDSEFAEQSCEIQNKPMKERCDKFMKVKSFKHFLTCETCNKNLEFGEPSCNSCLVDSPSTLVNSRSNGNLGKSQRPTDLGDRSNSFLKKGQKIAKNADSFSDSLRHMAKQLLELKYDAPQDIFSQDVEQQDEEYVADILVIPNPLLEEVDVNVLEKAPIGSVEEGNQHITGQEIVAGFVVQPKEVAAEVENVVASVDNLATLKSKEGLENGHDFVQDELSTLQREVELQIHEDGLEGSQNVESGNIEASSGEETYTDDILLHSNKQNHVVTKEHFEINNQYESISNVPKNHVTLIEIGTVESMTENYDLSVISSQDASSLGGQLQQEDFSHEGANLVQNNKFDSTNLDDASKDSMSTTVKDQEASAVTLSSPGSYTLNSFQPLFKPQLSVHVHNTIPLELSEADVVPNIETGIRENIAENENSLPMKDTTLFEVAIEAQPCIADKEILLQEGFESVETSILQSDKANAVEEKFFITNSMQPIAKEVQHEISENDKSFDSRDSPEPPYKIKMEDISYKEFLIEVDLSRDASQSLHRSVPDITTRSDEQDTSYELVNTPSGSLFVASEATKMAPGENSNAAIRNYNVDQSDYISLLDEAVSKEVQQNVSSVVSNVETSDGFSSSNLGELPLQTFPSFAGIISETSINSSLSEASDGIPPLPPLPPLEWRSVKLPFRAISSSGKIDQPPRPRSTPLLPTERDPSECFQVHESELDQSVNRQFENKMPHHNHSTSEKELPQHFGFPTISHMSDESHDFDPLNKEVIMVIPPALSTVEDDKHAHNYEAQEEGASLPSDQFLASGSESLLHGENQEALKLVEITSLEGANLNLNQTGTTSDKEVSVNDAQIRDEDGKNQFSNEFSINVETQPPISSIELPNEEDKSCDNGSLSMQEVVTSAPDDNTKSHLEAEKQVKELPSIPTPPRYPLIHVTPHDRSMLRKVPKLIQPAKPMADERNALLDQIRNKSFNLKPVLAKRPMIMGRPSTNLKVVAILERANAIRQAVANDNDDDDDSWSDS